MKKRVVVIVVLALVLWIILRQDRANEHGGYKRSEIDDEGVAELQEGRLLNLDPFRMILEPSACAKNHPRLGVILVTSYVGHDDVRAAHRKGMSDAELRKLGLARVFLLAAVPPSERFITQNSILSEQRRYGDLLQGDFVENYRNLTYKHVMGLKWAATRCSHAQFIVKIDDDSVYDIFRVYEYLRDHPELRHKSFLAGYMFRHQKVIRQEADKHFVSPDEYPGEEFPTYLSGWLYITNPLTARQLVIAAHRKRFFWIDDTFVTGIAASDVNLEFVDLTHWFSANPDFLDCCVRDMKLHNLACEFAVGPNGGDTQLLAIFQKELHRCFETKNLCRERLGLKENIRNTCVTAQKDLLRSSHGNAIVRPLKL